MLQHAVLELHTCCDDTDATGLRGGALLRQPLQTAEQHHFMGP